MGKQSIFAYLGINTDEFQKGMGKAKTQMNGFEKAGASFAKNIGGMFAGAFAVTAVISFGKELLDVSDIQEKAQAKVAQAVKQTGGVAGKSTEELYKFASGLQEITTFGDEKILNEVTAQLLTFTNVAGEQFDRAQVAALDLATVLGGDLQSVSIQLGKALNDPVKGITALQRSGVSFSSSQKEVIKSMVATGDIASAQTLILDELNRQYGGQAEAAAKSGSGRLQQLANSWGDFKEVLGAGLRDAIYSILDAFGELWDVIKEIFAPIGELTSSFNGLGEEFSFGALLGDILSISIKGIALFLKPLVWLVQKVAEGFKYLYANSELVRTAFDYIKRGVNAIVKVFSNLGAIMSSIGNSFSHLWTAIKTMNFDGLGGKISGEFKKAFDTKPVEEHAAVIKVAAKETKTLTAEQLKAIEELNKKRKELYERWRKEDLNKAFLGTEEIKIDWDDFTLTGDKPKGLLEGIGDDIEMPDFYSELDNELNKVNLKADQTRQRIIESANAINGAFASIATGGLATLGTALGTAFAGGDLASIGAEFSSMLAGVITSLGTKLIEIGVVMSGIMDALMSGGFSNPALLIGGGIALVALGAAMKNMMGSPVGFADGGLVTGSVFANIGEGIGTNSANPEVIAPLDKLKNFINPSGGGMGGGDVQFRIEGNTLVGILNRQTKTAKFSR
jgi:hypothetical protein